MSKIDAPVAIEVRQALYDKLNDFDALWLTLYGEFRGEPVDAQIGGGNVIYNRVSEGGKNIKDVCLKPKQFTCWNLDDPNLKAILTVYSLDVSFRNLRLVNQLKYISAGIIASQFDDNTKGSNHYLSWALYHSDKVPNWAIDKTAKFKVALGRTVFLWCL
jgi:N-acetylmuramoyl-L-alanine amidase